MIFASEPYVLHLLAGSHSISALDAVKELLDNGTHDANEREPQDNLSPLHVAAAWDNLAMCQLLIHYGADTKAVDIDKRQPVDVATGKCRKFLKKYNRKKRKDQNKLLKVLSFLFGKSCAAVQYDKSYMSSPFKIVKNDRRSCPSLILNTSNHFFSAPVIDDVEKDSYLKLEKRLSSTSSYKTADDRELTIDGYETANSIDFYLTTIDEPKNKINEINLNKNLENSTVQKQNKLFFLKTNNLSNLLSTNISSTSSNTLKCKNNKLYPSLSCNNGKTRNVNYDKNTFFEEMELQENFQNSVRNNFREKEDFNVENFVDKFQTCLSLESKKNTKELNDESDFCKYLSNLDITVLKKKLKEKNFSIGPINKCNRRLYEKVLAKLETNQIINKPKKYSFALEKMFSDKTENTIALGRKKEQEICNSFSQTMPKNEVTFFCYLLIDPTRLPACVETCSLQEFVNAIFYVGKGKRSRPLQHLCDASQCRKKATAMSAKLQRISSLWDNGNGVISLQICQNIHSDEAFIREKCMLEAIGIENLTNVVKGNITSFKKLPCIWSKKDMEECGALLIQKAHAIFCNERCRAITEADIEIITQSSNFSYTKNNKLKN